MADGPSDTVFLSGCCFVLAWWGTMVALLIIPLTNWSFHVDTSVANLDEIQFEWNKEFINKIYTVDENQKCLNSDEPIFSFIWPGAMHTCYYKNKYWAGGTCVQ